MTRNVWFFGAAALIVSLAPALAKTDPYTNSLIQRWQYAHPICKGTVGDPDDTITSNAAYRTRDAIGRELTRREYCIIVTPNGVDERDWRPCKRS